MSRWYVLRTTQNGDFVLLLLCVAPCWRSGALSARWRSVGALAPERVVPYLVSPCAHARFCWMFISTHATALKPSHSNRSYPLHHLQHQKKGKELDVILSSGVLFVATKSSKLLSRKKSALELDSMSQAEVGRATSTSVQAGFGVPDPAARDTLDGDEPSVRVRIPKGPVTP